MCTHIHSIYMLNNFYCAHIALSLCLGYVTGIGLFNDSEVISFIISILPMKELRVTGCVQGHRYYTAGGL